MHHRGGGGGEALQGLGGDGEDDRDQQQHRSHHLEADPVDEEAKDRAEAGNPDVGGGEAVPDRPRRVGRADNTTSVG